MQVEEHFLHNKEEEVKRLRINRFAVAAGLSLGLALAVSGVAFAYVTATGTGTGTGRVGTASTTLTGKLAVSVSPCATPTAVLPGEAQTCAYSVKNTTKGQVHFGSNTVALTTTGVAHTTVVKATGGTIAGCKFSWFTISVTTQPLPATLAATATTATNGVVTLKLTTETVTQGACLGTQPKFTVHVPT